VEEKYLNLGGSAGGRPFKLPLDALVRTFAFIGIRGSGKTCGATVFAEELAAAGLPWIALDPTGVWWGLRANRDGSPGGLRGVVVVGGEHGDLPLDKGSGAQLARALVAANVCAVIDLSQESKTVWRTFLADFCNALMSESPETPRHIFVEEGPEFVPQRPVGNAMKIAHAALDRLIRLGRNRGYGATIISQRAATIDKDVLSQAENVFTFRLTHNLDRKAMKDWVSGKADDPKRFEKFLAAMAGLKEGQAYFWSPAWLEALSEMRFRVRNTYHPGETRRVGQALKTVALSDAQEFVNKVRQKLARTAGPAERHPLVPGGTKKADPSAPEVRDLREEVSHDLRDLQNLREEAGRLQGQLKGALDNVASLEARAREAERRLAAVRTALQPQYDAFRALFENLATSTTAAGGASVADFSIYEPWLQRAGRDGSKRRRMLEVLLQRNDLTRHQLATLAGVSLSSSTLRNGLSWLKRNGLAVITGESVKLRAV